jgi:hypothetical protein
MEVLYPRCAGFVPPAPIELRDLTRTRRQLVHEIARHVLRIQKTLEDANLKLTQVMSDSSMLTAAYFMLRDGVEYHDLGSRHVEQRDKDQLTKRLLQRLRDLGVARGGQGCMTTRAHGFTLGEVRDFTGIHADVPKNF